LRGVDALLITGTSLAGVLIGAALDPVGQRLADLSRADDERRQAEAQKIEEAEALQSREALPNPDTQQSQEERLPIPSDGAGPDTVRSLLPAGRSPGRTVAAALVTGVLFGASASHFGRDVIVAPFCIFFGMLVAVSFTDLSHRLVPRRLLYGVMALVVPLLVVTSAVDHRWYSLSGSAIAGAVAFAVFFAVWWFIPQGMGFGDVRLAGAIGVTVGYLSLLHAYGAFFAGFLIGSVFGLVMAAVWSSGRKTRIPFGPSLAVGAVLGVLWGGPVAHSVFHTGSGVIAGA
jgi:leader peptidase (prepilin peptidase) / N-methyltransferase